MNDLLVANERLSRHRKIFLSGDSFEHLADDGGMGKVEGRNSMKWQSIGY